MLIKALKIVIFGQEKFVMLYTAMICTLKNDDALNLGSVKDFRNTIKFK